MPGIAQKPRNAASNGEGFSQQPARKELDPPGAGKPHKDLNKGMNLLIVYISGRPLRPLLGELTAQDTCGSQVGQAGRDPRGINQDSSGTVGLNAGSPVLNPSCGASFELHTDPARQVLDYSPPFFQTRKATLVILVTVYSEHSINTGGKSDHLS